MAEHFEGRLRKRKGGALLAKEVAASLVVTGPSQGWQVLETYSWVLGDAHLTQRDGEDWHL